MFSCPAHPPGLAVPLGPMNPYPLSLTVTRSAAHWLPLKSSQHMEAPLGHSAATPCRAISNLTRLVMIIVMRTRSNKP